MTISLYNYIISNSNINSIRDANVDRNLASAIKKIAWKYLFSIQH